jgi:hypothetical protein
MGHRVKPDGDFTCGPVDLDQCRQARVKHIGGGSFNRAGFDMNAIMLPEAAERRHLVAQELQVQLNKLLADAAECETIGNLVNVPDRRAAAYQLAEQYREMAERLHEQIDALRC